MTSSSESPRPDAAADDSENDETAASAADQQLSVWQRMWRWLRETVVVLVVALTISALVRALIGQVFVIPSGSMESTVHVGDRVFAVKVVDAQRGDIIVFRDPGGWIEDPPAKPGPFLRGLQVVGVWPDTSTNHLLKRLIGMPGDSVECCDARGRLKVNGVAIDEPYLKEGYPAAAVPFKVVVPQGRFFAMGDNRNHSKDSRCHLATMTNDGEPRGMRAFVPIDNIVGPAKFRLAPLDRFGYLRNPGNFAHVPAPTTPAPAQATIVPEGVGC